MECAAKNHCFYYHLTVTLLITEKLFFLQFYIILNFIGLTPEKGHRWSANKGSVSDLALIGEVVGRLDGRGHALDRQEGRQVCRVRGEDDQDEEPPDAADNSSRGCSRIEVRAVIKRGWIVYYWRHSYFTHPLSLRPSSAKVNISKLLLWFR